MILGALHPDNHYTSPGGRQNYGGYDHVALAPAPAATAAEKLVILAPGPNNSKPETFMMPPIT